MIDEDRSAVVICDTSHRIVYLNPAACERYCRRGGADLVGKSLLDCHNAESCEKIDRILDWFRLDRANNRVHTFYNEKENKDVYMIALRDENGGLIGYYERHEYRSRDPEPLYRME
ncbi:MAG: PAS domain-containing protein [Eubacteriales bacterium]